MANNLDKLNNLSEKEKETALEILKQISKVGSSTIYNELLYSDYKEIPVTITEFLHNPKYLGKALTNEEGKFTIFPYWEELLKEIYPNNIDPPRYNTLALTGGIGLGKSTFAVICILYDLYRMLCLKDPYLHYGLQPIDLITFAVLNITLDAAKGVAWDKIQSMLQSSEWFLNHGTLSKSDPPTWKPPKGIELIYGSQPRHILGRCVFTCVDEDTVIKTSKGDFTVKELVGQNINVYNYDAHGDLVISDDCFVLPTKQSTEEIEIVLEDGTSIRCTPEHKFLLDTGEYKEARDLTERDNIVNIDNICGEQRSN